MEKEVLTIDEKQHYEEDITKLKKYNSSSKK